MTKATPNKRKTKKKNSKQILIVNKLHQNLVLDDNKHVYLLLYLTMQVSNINS